MAKFKYALLAIAAFAIFASMLYADVLDVSIKGIASAKKVKNRKKDYTEAVLDAKRQAIEQAGVQIESKTTVINSMVYQDFIESQSKGILLPGFQIIDIGYTADRTYQVVLVGKIKTGTNNFGLLILYSEVPNIYINDVYIDNYKPLLLKISKIEGQYKVTEETKLENEYIYIIKLEENNYKISISDFHRPSRFNTKLDTTVNIKIKTNMPVYCAALYKRYGIDRSGLFYIAPDLITIVAHYGRYLYLGKEEFKKEYGDEDYYLILEKQIKERINNYVNQ